MTSRFQLCKVCLLVLSILRHSKIALDQD
uniref:Uncharacterized protein n=1 Tax=Triticum urartu TaxID=4572 RepID=A0A8R7URB8_TRIUA